LQTEAQLALRHGDGARAYEVAKEMAACQHSIRTRIEMEQLGLKPALERRRPAEDVAEQARIDAMCQTSGPEAQMLEHQLVLLAAAQGIPQAVYWAHEERLDPTGRAAQQIAQWALTGHDIASFNKVLLQAQPEVFSLNDADRDVIRKAAALAAQTPDVPSLWLMKRSLETAEEEASLVQAGVRGPAGHALYKEGKIPALKFAELHLSPDDERRAQALVEAMIQSRRRR